MGRSRTGRPVHGILLLDKRIGVSSNRALQEVKRLFNAAKAGHTGSLDPLATGLLPVCFGEATKVSGLLLEHDKRYRVEIKLGVRTDTGDLEGSILETKTVPVFNEPEILAILDQLTGRIEQIPPMYSALKHQGKKLYELARAGETVERSARTVSIFEINLQGYCDDVLILEVHCSKGTYIRTLAEDIGQALGCGGTVQMLRRLQTGEFGLAQAQTFEDLEAMSENQRFEKLIPVDEPLKTLPEIDLDQQQATNIRQGQILQINQGSTGQVRMYHEGHFLGLGEMRMDGKLAPKKLFIINN